MPKSHGPMQVTQERFLASHFEGKLSQLFFQQSNPWPISYKSDTPPLWPFETLQLWEKYFTGRWRWALVSPDGVAPGWSVCLPPLIFPCTIKSTSSLLAPAHPGGPGKRAVKRLWWCGAGHTQIRMCLLQWWHASPWASVTLLTGSSLHVKFIFHNVRHPTWSFGICFSALTQTTQYNKTQQRNN